MFRLYTICLKTVSFYIYNLFAICVYKFIYYYIYFYRQLYYFIFSFSILYEIKYFFKQCFYEIIDFVFSWDLAILATSRNFSDFISHCEQIFHSSTITTYIFILEYKRDLIKAEM